MSEDLELNSECTLRCENHFSVLISKLQNLLAHNKFVDVTLVVENQLIKAHRIILIAFSRYFEEHFSNLLDDRMLQEVTLQGVSADSIKALIQYMYTGEVTVPKGQLPMLLETASFLKMKGFYMEALEEDMTISQMSTSISKSNEYWKTSEIVIKKETDEHEKVEALGSSDDNRDMAGYPSIPKSAIKEELMDIENQSQETNETEELRLFDSVGIESNLTHLPIPISFKRRYSNDDEAAGVDNGEKNAEILDQNDQIIVQSTEYDRMSGISEHSSLNDDNIGSIIDSSDEDTSSGTMVEPSQIRLNQKQKQDLGLPPKKKSYLMAQKTVSERPFKCTNSCGRSYKRQNYLNRHLKYECGKQQLFHCTQCEQRFCRKESVHTHLTNIHKIDRSLHVISNTGLKSRPIYDFKCDRCERTYKQKKHLTRHRNNECGVEPSFPCAHCDYRAAHKSRLMEHIRSIHG